MAYDENLEIDTRLNTGQLQKDLGSLFDASALKNQLIKWCDDIVGQIKDEFGIRSPSQVMRDEVGKMIALGVSEGIDENSGLTFDSLNSMKQGMLEIETEYSTEETRLNEEKEQSDERKRQEEYQKKLSSAKSQVEIEKIKQDEIERLQIAADEKNLKHLQEQAKQEREALEQLKKNVIDAYTEMAQQAGQKIDEIRQLQDEMAQKLENYGTLYETVHVKDVEGYETTYTHLRDLQKDTEQLLNYKDAIDAVKERGAPPEFLSVLKEMSVEDGLTFTKLLLSQDNDNFSAYIDEWKKKQETAEKISKELYAGEAQEVKEDTEEMFRDVPQVFASLGIMAGSEFYNNYLKQMEELSRALKSITISGDGLNIPLVSQGGAASDSAQAAAAAGVDASSNQSQTLTLKADIQPPDEIKVRENIDTTLSFMTDELKKAGFTVPEAFFTMGKNAAKRFEDGILIKIDSVMDKIRAAIETGMNQLVPALTFAGSTAAAGQTMVQNTANYTFYSSSDTTSQQLAAARRAELLNKNRGI